MFSLNQLTFSSIRRSQWPHGLRRRSAAARLLGLWVPIPLGAWMCVCCECCVLSGRGLCNELITLPEESYRLWCVVVCDLETSRMRRPWPALGRSATGGKKLSTLAVGPTRYLVLGYRMSYCRDNTAEVWRWPFQLSLISILKRNRSVPPFPIYLYGLFFY
jgi:hypothetical protein